MCRISAIVGVEPLMSKNNPDCNDGSHGGPSYKFWETRVKPYAQEIRARVRTGVGQIHADELIRVHGPKPCRFMYR